MISRIWHGYTTFENAAAYESLLKEEIFTGIKGRNIKGYKGIQLLRSDKDSETEFITIMWFNNIDSVKEFAGKDYENAVVPEKARKLLSRFDQISQHYDVEDVYKPDYKDYQSVAESKPQELIQSIVYEFKTETLPILLATGWIGISEFFRNQYLLKSMWINHYEKLGLTFPADPITGAAWGVWSLMLAVSIFLISRKFKLWETTLLSWFIGIAMMWLVLGNLAVLPHKLVLYALPLSILETFVASWIMKKFQPVKAQ